MSKVRKLPFFLDSFVFLLGLASVSPTQQTVAFGLNGQSHLWAWTIHCSLFLNL